MDVVCSKLIRPKRFVYTEEDLGPKTFRLQSAVCRREDFTVRNARNLRLECSWFIPLHNSPLPCVVFCHGNCGSRIDSLEIVRWLLPLGISVIAFDCSGSGLSEGQYVSLGYNEKDDIAAVVDYARRQPHARTVSVWGRSMGASAAVLYASEHPSLTLLVADSPFSSLSELIKEQTQKMRWVPSSMSMSLIRKIRKRLMREAKFDIEEVSPVKVVGKCNAPAVFIHSVADELIPIEHSQKLFTMYPNALKQMHRAEGSHTAHRSACLIEAIGRSVHLFSGTQPFSSSRFPPINTQRSLRTEGVRRRSKVLPLPRAVTQVYQSLVMETHRSALEELEMSDACPH